MPIVISDALALTLESATDADYPVICWDNLITSSNVAASETEATGYPESNLANPSTVQLWKSSTTVTQYLTVTLGAAQTLSYLGAARPNFAAAGATLTVQIDPGTGIWEDVAGPQIPGDDSPLLFVFEETTATGIRLKIENATIAPQAAVLSVGQALRMQRGVQPGGAPFPHGRTRETVNGAAQNGDYLGDITIREHLTAKAMFKALGADWYRNNLMDFAEVAREPFFFAWRPDSYPNECAYCWCVSDPIPEFAYMSGDWVDLTLDMEGLTL